MSFIGNKDNQSEILYTLYYYTMLIDNAIPKRKFTKKKI